MMMLGSRRNPRLRRQHIYEHEHNSLDNRDDNDDVEVAEEAR